MREFDLVVEGDAHRIEDPPIVAGLRKALAAAGAKPEHVVKWNVLVVEGRTSLLATRRSSECGATAPILRSARLPVSRVSPIPTSSSRWTRSGSFLSDRRLRESRTSQRDRTERGSRVRLPDLSPFSPRGGEGNTVRTRTPLVRLCGWVLDGGAAAPDPGGISRPLEPGSMGRRFLSLGGFAVSWFRPDGGRHPRT